MQNEEQMNSSFQSETSTVIVQNGDESFITVISDTDQIELGEDIQNDAEPDYLVDAFDLFKVTLEG